MKLYIYKLLIAIFFLFIFFELTIGKRVDYLTDKFTSFTDSQERNQLKKKILAEMEKGSKKDNYFSENERIIISNFINKLLKELNINQN